MASCACWPRRGTPPPPTCGRSALGRRPHHGVEKRSLSTGARGLCAVVGGELCDMWYTPVLLPKGWAWDRQTPVFGPHLPVQRLRSITPVCPPASPATPLPPLRGASRGSNYIPERTTVGLSAVCRSGHDTDPQAPLAVTIGKPKMCRLEELYQERSYVHIKQFYRVPYRV